MMSDISRIPCGVYAVLVILMLLGPGLTAGGCTAVSQPEAQILQPQRETIEAPEPATEMNDEPVTAPEEESRGQEVEAVEVEANGAASKDVHFDFGKYHASVYNYDGPDSMIGTTKKYRVKKRESLIEIARWFDIGYNEIVEANRDLDPFVPGAGAVVTLPTSWLLPDLHSYSGIVINLSEMRLYYFFSPKGSSSLRTFPIGIGSEGTDTPTGDFTVIQKILHPAWHVPPSIKEEDPSLPNVVPPGPNNPLGSHALRLSLGTVLIHGTNRPYAIGRKMSHGCIRMYPEDIPQLFALVPKGVRVTIVRQPLKAGTKDNKVYLEVHDDPQAGVSLKEASALLAKKGLLGRVDTKKLFQALERKDGIPVDISE